MGYGSNSLTCHRYSTHPPSCNTAIPLRTRLGWRLETRLTHHNHNSHNLLQPGQATTAARAASRANVLTLYTHLHHRHSFGSCYLLQRHPCARAVKYTVQSKVPHFRPHHELRSALRDSAIAARMTFIADIKQRENPIPHAASERVPSRHPGHRTPDLVDVTPDPIPC